jgi:hypothetical protein
MKCYGQGPLLACIGDDNNTHAWGPVQAFHGAHPRARRKDPAFFLTRIVVLSTIISKTAP